MDPIVFKGRKAEGMPFVIRCRRGVKPYIREAIRDFAKQAHNVVRLDHIVVVHVVPAPAVKSSDGERLGFGVFSYRDDPADVPSCCIWLAANVPVACQAERLDAILHTFAHELAHYEQWRDGRTMTERGVNVRAKSIRRQLESVTA